MLRKNLDAVGSFINTDRPGALDLLGFSSQLVFDTFATAKALVVSMETPTRRPPGRGPAPCDDRVVFRR